MEQTDGAMVPSTAGWLAGHNPTISVSDNYRRFAQLEAHGRSPAYEELALEVAKDATILAYLGDLPADKRQPNLLFAAATWLLGQPPDPGSLRRLLADRSDALTAEILQRRTQTNEALRCATLLPALADLRPPLALIEVGASAGLTLLVDRYSYDYGDRHLPGADPRAPVLACRLTGTAPPLQVPVVAWRAGIDLHPLHVDDPDDVRWLECLIWPGEANRAERLAGAVAAARRVQPVIHQGDLLDDLGRVADGAPADATLVVYHSAALAYVDEAKRAAFAAAVRAVGAGRELGAVWLSNEAPGVVAGVATPPSERAGFVLVRDGREALAVTDPHGAWAEWGPGATAP